MWQTRLYHGLSKLHAWYYLPKLRITSIKYNILNVSGGELSDSELLNITQLTVDGLVNIVDNIEHGHDSGIVDVVIAESWMVWQLILICWILNYWILFE